MEPERKRGAEGEGAFEGKPVFDPELAPPPDEFANPAGIGRGECDDDPLDTSKAHDPGCELEVTAQIEDQVLGETMPGYGIPGFDAEEDGGG